MHTAPTLKKWHRPFNLHLPSRICAAIMEALIAVGLAGNVVQFLQGVGKLISVATAMQRNGVLNRGEGLPDIYKLSTTIITQATILTSRLKASSATLPEEDQVGAQWFL
jgi:hypothetical protein